MKTLKKTLCLVLALVMAFSLMSVASAANLDGYTDADKVGAAYEEAVEVLLGLGIVNGVSATEIDPEGYYTRAQAAKIATYLAVGPKAAEMLPAAASFEDVPASHWASKYIAYCAGKNILNGVSATEYAPEEKVTGYQFAKMILAAAGYGANDEFVGSNWAIATAQWALNNKINLFEGDATAATNDPITRQQAMLIAFNALTNGANENGVEFVQWSKLSETYSYDQLNGTFATKNYAELDKEEGTGFNEDAYGRPGYTWEVSADAKENIFIAKKAVASNAGAMTAAELLSALEGYKVNINGTAKALTTKLATNDVIGVVVTADGYAFGAGITVEAAQNDKTVAAAVAGLMKETGVYEVYADSNKVITEIVEINTYADTVATVTKANADTDTKASIALTGGLTLETDKFAKDDVVLYTKVWKDSAFKIVTIEKANSFTGTLTSFTSAGKYTIDGKEYEVSDSIVAGFSMPAIDGKAYVWYTNVDGGIIYKTAVKGEAPAVISDYALITDSIVKETQDNWGTTTGFTAQVKAVLSNGETGTYDITVAKATTGANKGSFVYKIGTTEVVVPTGTLDLSALENNVYTYTLDGTTLALSAKLDAIGTATDKSAVEVGVNDSAAITKASTTIASGTDTVIANAETVFVLKTATGLVVKTGIAALESTSIAQGAAVIIADAKYSATTGYTYVAKVVLAAETTFVGASATTIDEYIYVANACTTTVDANGAPVYTYVGVKADGTKINVTYSANTITAGIYKYDTDNAIVGVAQGVSNAEVGTVAGTTVDLGGSYLTVNSTTKVVAVADGATLVDGAKVYYVDITSDGIVDVLFITAKAAE